MPNKANYESNGNSFTIRPQTCLLNTPKHDKIMLLKIPCVCQCISKTLHSLPYTRLQIKLSGKLLVFQSKHGGVLFKISKNRWHLRIITSTFFAVYRPCSSSQTIFMIFAGSALVLKVEDGIP